MWACHKAGYAVPTSGGEEAVVAEKVDAAEEDDGTGDPTVIVEIWLDILRTASFDDGILESSPLANRK